MPDLNRTSLLEASAPPAVSADTTAHLGSFAPEAGEGARDDASKRVAAARRAALLVKRMVDLIGSLLILLVLSPLLLAIGVWVKFDSPGPAVFAQRRLGKNGKPFTFYKFRTMYDGNDPSIHKEYVAKLITSGDEELKGEGGSYKLESDPRVTRCGHLLRRTSLDELPQFLNVLLGQMSIVGPRPPLDYEVELYDERCARRLEVTPGITGLWQVCGRCEKTFDEMVDLDLDYIDRWSLALDLKIMYRTVGVVLGRKGAW